LADEKNVTLEQFKDFMTKADERLDKLEVGKENKVSPVSITIPTEGWASEEIGETDEVPRGFYEAHKRPEDYKPLHPG